VSARPTFGITLLEVSFDGSGSSDPNGDPLSYTWNFGDESAATKGVTASHTYNTNDLFNVQLVVGDQKGGTTSATLTIRVGNPPVGNITLPNPGDRVEYTGTGTDPEDGALPASAFSWEELSDEQGSLIVPLLLKHIKWERLIDDSWRTGRYGLPLQQAL
jgi:PKD repeat protein